MSLTPAVADHLRQAAAHLFMAADKWQPNDQAAFDGDPAIADALPMSLDELAAEIIAFCDDELTS